MLNQTAEVARAAAWLDAFAAQAGLADDVTNKLHVVLDEVLTNVMKHALLRASPGGETIELELRRAPAVVELIVCDRGPAFDATDAIPIPAATRAAERRPGGVGLLFIRALMDEVRYTRLNGANRTILRKRLETEGST